MKDERTSRDGVPLVRKHLWLAKADIELIEALWGKQIGVSKFVRTVLADYIRQLKAKAAAKGRPLAITGDTDDVQGADNIDMPADGTAGGPSVG